MLSGYVVLVTSAARIRRAINGCCENKTMVFATGSPPDLTQIVGGCLVP